MPYAHPTQPACNTLIVREQLSRVHTRMFRGMLCPCSTNRELCEMLNQVIGSCIGCVATDRCALSLDVNILSCAIPTSLCPGATHIRLHESVGDNPMTFVYDIDVMIPSLLLFLAMVDVIVRSPRVVAMVLSLQIIVRPNFTGCPGPYHSAWCP